MSSRTLTPRSSSCCSCWRRRRRGRRRPALRSGAGTPPRSVLEERGGVALEGAFSAAGEIKRTPGAFPELRHDALAILRRTPPAMGAPFEEALRALDLPYEVR